MDLQAAVESTVINTNQVIPQRNKKRGRPSRDEDAATWAPIFLARYRETGSSILAGEAAGIDRRTARRYRLAHPAFAADIKHARRAFRDELQYLLVQQGRGVIKGNVIAVLARLKATGRKMAERYSEKAVDARVMNLTINQVNGMDEAAAHKLLAAMLPQVTPATQRMLAAPERSEAPPPPIIDMEEPA